MNEALAIEATDDITDACFREFVKLTYEMTGIQIGADRKSMLVSRLRKRLAKNNIPTYREYIDFVRSNPAEEQHFIDGVTTNETYFYRTPRVWDFIRNDFLKEWMEKNPSRPVRIWSAASSTGEEAHTLGIILQNFKDRNNGFDYAIFGTDISPAVVATATEGLYKGRSIHRFRQTQPDLFSKYMVGDDDSGYRVAPHIKAKIRFKNHNLFKRLVGQKSFDLIMLRNVLIYFSKADQELVLRNAAYALDKDGALAIGESESLAQLETDFVFDRPLIYRLPSAAGA